MKADVQYNDYVGTTAADRSDLFIDMPGDMTKIIMNKFGIQLNEKNYRFVGISVYGIKSGDMQVSVLFREHETNKVVRYTCYSVDIQTVLDLFKRFEFQVGEHLEEINNNDVTEIKETV